MLMRMSEEPKGAEESIDSKFGTRLRRYRDSKGLSISDLAELSKTKDGTIRQIELHNTGMPSFINGLKLAAALGISPYELAELPEPGSTPPAAALESSVPPPDLAAVRAEIDRMQERAELERAALQSQVDQIASQIAQLAVQLGDVEPPKRRRTSA